VIAGVTLDTRTPGWGDVSSPDPQPTSSNTFPQTGDRSGTITVDATGHATWSATKVTNARVYISADGGPEILFSETPSGDQTYTASSGHAYRFVLRPFGDPLVLADGAPAPANVAVNTTVSVSIQGFDAPIQFVGLVPGFVGLLQWNVSVASDIDMNGKDAEVKVFVGSIPANLTYLPIVDAAAGTIAVAADGTVTWSTSNTTGAQVFVATDGGDEVLFAEGQSGSQKAAFAEPGHVYVFVLRPYRDGVLGKVLATATLDTTSASSATKKK